MRRSYFIELKNKILCFIQLVILKQDKTPFKPWRKKKLQKINHSWKKGLFVAKTRYVGLKIVFFLGELFFMIAVEMEKSTNCNLLNIYKYMLVGNPWQLLFCSTTIHRWIKPAKPKPIPYVLMLLFNYREIDLHK